MAAALQGFPRDWLISGRKTAGYRQIGNAFPPPVAQAVGRSIRSAIEASREAEEAKPTRLLREAS
jgi:DNA (cytosine-5)-methyltransferase 1